jgi:hypothetical protein
MPDRHAYGAFDQGHHGDAVTGLIRIIFSRSLAISARQRAMIGMAIGQR